MRRAASQPLLRHFQESDDDDKVDREEEEEEDKQFRINAKELRGVDSISKQVTCMTLLRGKSTKTSEEAFSWKKYASWRQEQKSGAAKLKKQLKARWAIHRLIENQLAQFQAHYNRATGPTRMSNVAQLHVPKWAPAHELAAVSWLGDWRPTLILEIVRALSPSFTDPNVVERHDFSQLINDVRIEEAVIDEEMAEIQANCVLNLPFGRVMGRYNKSSNKKEPPSSLAIIRSEFKKIHRVIAKAQNLRMKALKLAVKGVLMSQIDAAEFLVALVGIQENMHQFAEKCKSSKGSVCIKELL